MDEFLIKYGRIPINLNLDEILDGVEGNKTKIKYLKDGIIYFVSLLTIDNYNFVKLKDGYIPLSKVVLRNIVGDNRSSEIVKILKNNGVIEFLHHQKNRSSRKYRLTEKYNIGEFTYVEFSDRIKTKLHQHRQKNGLEKEELYQISPDDISQEQGQKYQYVFHQFSKNQLDVDLENGKLFIKNLGLELFKKSILSSKYKGFILKSMFNYIGRLMNQLEDIHNKRDNLFISSTNHRFHSNLTSLQKTLRPFIKINGQDIGEVDISSSQPYILSTILNDKFTFSVDEGYNIHTIHQELFGFLQNSKTVVPSNKIGNNHYVLGVYLNDNDYNDLVRFTCFDFKQDFYLYILNDGKKFHPNFLKNKKWIGLGRDYIKKNIMNFLFDRNEYHREENDVIQLLNLLNPGLCIFIEEFNKCYTNREFSLLLQRSESYLMLGNVCKRINEEYPDIPFYTIHDSIITTQTNLEFVKDIMSSTISSITGKSLNVKSKCYQPTTEISDQIVNDIWDKVKISSQSRYNKMKSSILQINIRKGMEILLTKNEQDHWSEIMGLND